MRSIFLIVLFSFGNAIAATEEPSFYAGVPEVICSGGPFSSSEKPHGNNIDLTLSQRVAEHSIGEAIYESQEIDNYTVSVYMQASSSSPTESWWEKVITISYVNHSTNYVISTSSPGSVSLKINGEEIYCR